MLKSYLIGWCTIAAGVALIVLAISWLKVLYVLYGVNVVVPIFVFIGLSAGLGPVIIITGETIQEKFHG